MDKQVKPDHTSPILTSLKFRQPYSPEWRLEIASFYKLISYDINLQI